MDIVNPWITILVSASGSVIALIVAIVNNRAGQAKVEERLQNKIEEFMRTFSSHEAQLDKMWSWKDFHIRESQDTRQKFYEQLGELKGELAKRDGQFDAIIGQLKRIEDYLNNLKKKD